MRVYVVQRSDDNYCEYWRAIAVFSTKERALEFLKGKTIEIYHHVGMYETSIGREMSYDEWRSRKTPYYSGVFKHEVTECMTVGVTERGGVVGYYAPDGMRVSAEDEYDIEAFEVDRA